MIEAVWALAAVGLVSCSVFVALAGLAAVRFHRRKAATIPARSMPPVTLLKPLCGVEPNLRENLESFFRQDYPRFELVFGTRNAADPALHEVRDLQKKYPHVRVKIVFSGEPRRPNAKVCSLQAMYAVASHDFIVISDSDVRVTSDYVHQVVSPLLDANVGLVTCLYRGVPTGGLWTRLEALGMSVEMTSGVLVADLLEGMKFALGPTMATRRDVLQKTGGLATLADYCADDYVLGRQVHDAGFAVVLSTYVVDHVIINRAPRASFAHQVRWMKSTRFSRSMGHIGTGLTFAMPFGLLALAAGLLNGLYLGVLMFAYAVLNRMLLSVIAGWTVVGDRNALRYAWLYPVRDAMGFVFWAASFFGRTIAWRADRYRLEPGGKMVRLNALDANAPASKTIAVDDLA